MTEISFSKLRKSFLLGGTDALPATALHMAMATLEQREKDSEKREKLYEPHSMEFLSAALALFEAGISQKFNFGADGVLENLGMKSPVTQVFAYPEGAHTHYYAYAMRPNISATSQEKVYVMDVPVGFDGTYFTPNAPESSPLSQDDFTHGGMGTSLIRAVGALIEPNILTMDMEPVPLPASFDANEHQWIKTIVKPTHPFAKTLVHS